LNDSGSYYERALRHPLSSIWHDGVIGMIRELLPDGVRDLSPHLDLGTGDGVRIRMIKPEGRIAAVEPDPAMAAHARKRGIVVRQTSAERLPFRDRSFRLVTCLEMLEHVEHPVLVLTEAFRVLKPRGFFLCVVPNETLLFNIIWKAWTNFGMGRFWHEKHLHEYNLWKHTKGTPSLIDMLESVGFIPEKVATANMGMVVGVRSIKIS